MAAGDSERAGDLLRTLRGANRDELVAGAGIGLVRAGGYEAAVREFALGAFSLGRVSAPLLLRAVGTGSRRD